ncbi:hypothetical protein DRO_C0010 (plasmid) [Deinococcus radiodurans R1 = ATCC 13939 = DSM 20539]|nr:hypothetical protein DRO_C0010 [Deinococcus radiodurans R1 = ATCC 13939 = DSM 20539]
MHALDIGMTHDHMVREGGAEPVFQVIEGFPVGPLSDQDERVAFVLEP